MNQGMAPGCSPGRRGVLQKKRDFRVGAVIKSAKVHWNKLLPLCV